MKYLAQLYKKQNPKAWSDYRRYVFHFWSNPVSGVTETTQVGKYDEKA